MRSERCFARRVMASTFTCEEGAAIGGGSITAFIVVVWFNDLQPQSTRRFVFVSKKMSFPIACVRRAVTRCRTRPRHAQHGAHRSLGRRHHLRGRGMGMR